MGVRNRMDKGILETINYMSLRMEEYIDKAYEDMQEALLSNGYADNYRPNKNNINLAIMNLQKAHLINECMREMVNNETREYGEIYAKFMEAKDILNKAKGE